MSASYKLAKQFLGKEVRIEFDRPLGTKHPKFKYFYQVNYGYVPGVKAPDGEDLDAYYLGTDEPLKEVNGMCIAFIHREDDDDDKLIVVPPDLELSDEEIKAAVHFQEQWFDSKVIRK